MIGECVLCHRPMVSRAQPALPAHVRHSGRGLCAACAERARRHGTLADHERLTRPADELLDEWDSLRRQGDTIAQAAERLGITRNCLDQALSRGRRRGDPRAARDVVQANEMRREAS